MITLVAAVDYAMAIGKGGRVPWHLKADMDHFKNLTIGHPVVMGRKTYESIPEKYRPLPGRENWILTGNLAYCAPGCRQIHSIEEFLVYAPSEKKEIFVIGGAEIYALFLPCTKRIILTRVETLVHDADAFFPKVPGDDWCERIILTHGADPDNDHAFSIREYTRNDEF